MKKLIAMLLALTMVLGLAACGGNTAPAATEAPAAAPEAPVVEAPAATEAPAGPSSISVCLSSEPDTIDPALNSAVDGATLVSHLFSGLAKWGQDENGALALYADAAVELPEGVLNEDGTVT